MNDVIRRPDREETNEYYVQYIDLVPEGDILHILEEQALITLALLRSIPGDRATFSYAAGKWTIAELVNHLSDAERLYTMRAFWFARGMNTPLPSYEGDEAMATTQANERGLSSHIEEFAAVRTATLALFRNLPNDAWTRRGIASGFPFSVRSFAYIAAGHVIHHLRILQERYLTHG
jgi:DinB superfamily